MTRQVRVVVMVLLALALNGATAARVAFGQNEQSSGGDQQAADTSHAPAPEDDLTAAGVARRAEETNELIRQARMRVEADPAVSAAREQYPAMVAALDALMQDPASHSPEGLSRRRLGNLRQRWLTYRNQLENWQSTLEERSATLEAERLALAQTRAFWERGEAVAAVEDFPEAVLALIRSTAAAVDEAAGQIRQRLDEVLTLENQVTDELIRVTGVLSRIDAAEEAARSQLLQQDQVPLWQLRAPSDRSALVQEALESAREDIEILKRFSSNNRGDIVFHAALFVILLVLIVGLRRRTEDLARDDPAFSGTQHALSRPVSAALLVAVFFTGVIYPDAPEVVVDLARLIALVPIVRLLPGLLPREMRRSLYALVGLYLLEVVQLTAPEGSLVQRYLQLVVTLLALGGVIFVTRRSGWLAKQSGELLRWVLIVGRLAAAVLAISLIASVGGFVDLGELLTGATLLSAYVAVAVYAAAQVVAGLIRVVMQTPVAQSVNAVRRNTGMLTRRGVKVVRVASVLLWLASTLKVFEILDPVIGIVTTVLGKQFTAGSVSVSLGGMLSFFITLLAAFLASRFVRFILDEDVMPRVDLPRGVPVAILRLTHYVIIGFGVFIAIAAAGLQLDRLAFIIGALGVGIGFGLQNVVNNFISGLILIFERPIQEGDAVQVGTLIGTVKRIGIRSSTVRTFDGSEVIVPNGNLISNEVVNWTMSDRQRRVELPVGVAYGTDPHRVIEILHEAAAAHSHVLEHPEPHCQFLGFGDSSLDFNLRYWVPKFEDWLIVSGDVALAVHDALKEAGIEIPFPQRDLHVRSVDETVTLPSPKE